ncbi:putative bifunctional diguanylate cyclase/phosphodiesterase [Kosakonia sp.]|uniref:putative bifunctional diguanylate cyclase/phosphodiesterase n=1 Tax=Kosakonia sp. TaxID=1916651 RepID=UPI0028AC210C|nr:EAL domain-containing protein [Kosakonia sp.]
MLYVSWDPILIGISFLVAFIASFVALDSAGKVATSEPRSAIFWRFSGGATLGIGIWSMHYVGMLAMKMPVMMHYDLELTLLSFIIAMLTSILAINIAVAGKTLPTKRLLFASLLLGTGVVSMHYLGMASMMGFLTIYWNVALIALSVAIAFFSAWVALWLAFSLRQNTHGVFINRVFAALVMGASISAMHYTAMSAATFSKDGTGIVIRGHATTLMSHDVGELGLSLWVATTTLVIFGIMLFISMIDSQLRTSRLTDSLRQLNQQLEKQAYYDPLTGLANRSQLDNLLDACLSKASETRSTFALIYMDLDRFKLVNDAWGHHIGDQLLVAVAGRLSACISEKMSLARLGGDEFTLLVPDTHEDEVEALVKHLVATIQQPFCELNHVINVSLSAGISYYPQHGDTAHELKLKADTAMYSVKQEGRNSWAVFHAGMAQKTVDDPLFLQDLSQALSRDQFELWYQPQYHAPEHALAGFEALLRWRHPTRGVLLPATFLPMLEKTGLIISVGRWVIDAACRQLHHWNNLGFRHLTLAINLSPSQFEQHDIYDQITDSLQRYHIDPMQLTLEITENTALKNIERSVQLLNQFAQMGITVAIDDFGTGYSNMLMLKRLPATELKIDRSFVKDIRDNSRNVKIVSTIIDIAHSMNMHVVAEGIETAEQQALLTNMGCAYLQGFLFARPLPVEKVAVLLQQKRFTLSLECSDSSQKKPA